LNKYFLSKKCLWTGRPKRKDSRSTPNIFGQGAVYLKEDLDIGSLSLETSPINNLKLFIAGGAIEEHQLIRKSFSLLKANLNINVILLASTDGTVLPLKFLLLCPLVFLFLFHIV
jgi:hypothetical protein